MNITFHVTAGRVSKQANTTGLRMQITFSTLSILFTLCILLVCSDASTFLKPDHILKIVKYACHHCMQGLSEHERKNCIGLEGLSLWCLAAAQWSVVLNNILFSVVFWSQWTKMWFPSPSSGKKSCRQTNKNWRQFCSSTLQYKRYDSRGTKDVLLTRY